MKKGIVPVTPHLPNLNVKMMCYPFNNLSHGGRAWAVEIKKSVSISIFFAHFSSS
jgi:hypothetical protein